MRCGMVLLNNYFTGVQLGYFTVTRWASRVTQFIKYTQANGV